MKSIIKSTVIAASIALPFMLVPGSVSAGSEPFMGEINYVAFNYAPRGWAKCDGQLMPISENQALYALLGTTFGGNGRTTFMLPDMRGRVPVHMGQAPGKSVYPLGQMGGSEINELTVNQLAAHNHSVTAESTSTSTVAAGATVTSTLHVNDGAGSATPGGSYLAATVTGRSIYTSTAPNADLNAGSITNTLAGLNINTGTTTQVSQQMVGMSQTVENRQPYTVLNCVISLDGSFPSRN